MWWDNLKRTLLGEQEVVPQASGLLPDEEFLKKVSKEFETALSCAVLPGVDDDHARSYRKLGFHVGVSSHMLSDWLVKDIPNDPQRWVSHLRVVDAVRAAVKNEVITLEDGLDVELFGLLPDCDFAFFPPLVERYVESGEFFELLKLILDKAKLSHQRVPTRGDSQTTASLALFRVKMFRLYVFDLTREQEHQEQGTTMGELDQVPLEVRLSFCDVDADMSSMEIDWDYRARHELSTEQEILSAFQLLHTWS